MSNSLNSVQLIGNLCADPEVRTFPDGNQVANVTVATNERWKDKTTGEIKERAEFHRVVFRGKLAEIVGKYMHKGSKVYVAGQLQTRKWQDKDGHDRYSTEVVVGMRGQMIMLDSKSAATQAPARPGHPAEQAHAPAQTPTDDPAFDKDIPF